MNCKHETYLPFYEKPLCKCDTEPMTSDEVLYKFGGGQLVQNYVGDYILYGYAAAASCHVGDLIYSINKSTSNNNTGWLTVHDVVNNSMVNQKQVIVGHANGLCYSSVDAAFYVAPVFDESKKPDDVRWYAILKYDKEFNTYTEIKTPGISIMSVSYNWQTSEVYAYSYNHTIYKVSGGSIKEVVSVELPAYSYDINQGFAVIGDYFVLTSPRNNMLIGSLKSGKILLEKMLPLRDYSEKYYLGESEDIEFDVNGVLYCTNNIFLRSSSQGLANGIITEVVYGNLLNPSTYTFNPVNATYILTDASIDKFKNSDIELKHPMQINYMRYHDVVNNIVVNCPRHPFNEIITFNCPINIDLRGLWQIMRIIARGDLCLFTDSSAVGASPAIHIITATDDHIQLERGAKLQVCDDFNLTGDSRLKITFGNFKSLISIRRSYKVDGVSSTEMQIGSADEIKADSRGLWWGSVRVQMEV